MDKDLGKRLFSFASVVYHFLRSMENTPENKVFKYQLIRSATSSGANYEEAQAAASRADFKNKIDIALREMRESNYWARLCFELHIGNNEKTKEIVRESDELKRILGSIYSKVAVRKVSAN